MRWRAVPLKSGKLLIWSADEIGGLLILYPLVNILAFKSLNLTRSTLKGKPELNYSTT